VFGSYEVLGDTNIEQQLPAILQDSKDRLESAAFVTGSGSGAPYGVVTRVAAVTTSRVAPTTGGTFTTASVADVYKVDEA
jgi:HK97 family phage major capsid protein